MALGFQPAEAGGPCPSQLQIHEAILATLQEDTASCEALYYKGGSFLADGSLVHFEVSQLEDPERGLLEWASPETRSPEAALAYELAHDRALSAALPRAAERLAEAGFPGRIVALRINEDRAGNACGAHESWQVEERPRSGKALLFALLLHPLVLLLLGLGFLAWALPLVVLLGAALFLYALVSLPAAVPLLGLPFRGLLRAMEWAGTYLVEPGPGPGQGVLARTFVLGARAGSWLFGLTASRALFCGHLPALLPFLATRPVFSGAGHLDRRGRFWLGPRAKITTKPLAAFVLGAWRPMVDVKGFFFRNPWRYLLESKRLHLVCGEANRLEHATWLKLATTSAVLDAIEAGALDDLELDLPEGPVGAFRRTCRDPGLRDPVARDRRSGALLSALEVQRRYLEATWRHAQEGEPSPERAAALVAWDETLVALQANPAPLADRVDWVRKLGLLQGRLAARLGLSTGEAWARLTAWGEVNELVESLAPAWEPAPGAPFDEPALRARLGRRGARRFRDLTRELDLAEWPQTRRAWLELKALDLRYHELGAEELLESAGPPPRAVLDAEQRARAEGLPPSDTRAALRAFALGLRDPERESTLRLGWGRIEATPKVGAPVIVSLAPEQTELSDEDTILLRAVLSGPRKPEPTAE